MSSLYFFKYAFSSIAHRILNLHSKSPKIISFDIFGHKCCLYPICHFKAVQDRVGFKARFVRDIYYSELGTVS